MKSSSRRPKSGGKLKASHAATVSRYLAAGMGATGLASVECEAEVVSLNLTALGSSAVNVTGTNAGIVNSGPPTDAVKTVTNIIPGIGFNQFNVYGGYSSNYQATLFGLAPQAARVAFAQTSPGGATAAPKNFGSSTFIDFFAGTWTTNTVRPLFAYDATKSPNFGPNSFLGFRVQSQTTTSDFYYGYFEVTWNNTSNQFQILSGAYESTPNVGIMTPAPVPEPSVIALSGIGALALGAGAIRRSRKARKAAAAAEDSPAGAV